jgi:hypothetical protein
LDKGTHEVDPNGHVGRDGAQWRRNWAPAPPCPQIFKAHMACQPACWTAGVLRVGEIPVEEPRRDQEAAANTSDSRHRVGTCSILQPAAPLPLAALLPHRSAGLQRPCILAWRRPDVGVLPLLACTALQQYQSFFRLILSMYFGMILVDRKSN